MPAAPDCAALRPSTAFLGKRLSASGDILSVRVRVPTGGFLKGRKAVALKKSARSRAVAQGSSPLRSTILVCPRSLLWDHIVIARQSDRGDLPFDLHFMETFGHLPCTAWRPARSKTPASRASFAPVPEKQGMEIFQTAPSSRGSRVTVVICLSICTLWRPSVTFHARPGGRHDQRPPASRASFAPVPAKQGRAICLWIPLSGDITVNLRARRGCRHDQQSHLQTTSSQ